MPFPSAFPSLYFPSNSNSSSDIILKFFACDKNIPNQEIGIVFINKIKEFISSKFESNFVNMDWQVSVLDRKNDNSNLNKSDKVEITTKFNSFNQNEQKYASHVIKMDFNEFSEIMSNFKKIDEQLHMFKN